MIRIVAAEINVTGTAAGLNFTQASSDKAGISVTRPARYENHAMVKGPSHFSLSKDAILDTNVSAPEMKRATISSPIVKVVQSVKATCNPGEVV
jgi:hypothetical protein